MQSVFGLLLGTDIQGEFKIVRKTLTTLAGVSVSSGTITLSQCIFNFDTIVIAVDSSTGTTGFRNLRYIPVELIISGASSQYGKL
jgi:hypothetical protein